MKKLMSLVLASALLFSMVSCDNSKKSDDKAAEAKTEKTEKTEMEKLVDNYAEVELTTDLSHLSANQKEMLSILIDVADIMEEIFWMEAIGDKETFMASLDDEAAKKYAAINYGPWDRLNGDKPFIKGYDKKPLGAQYYPEDITKEEFEAWKNENKTSWYTMVRRNDDGELYEQWYHEAFPEKINKAADLLDKAAELAENDGFKKYLKLRANALRTDDYLESDLAWLDMKGNLVDFVVGPIESYEDQFMGYRAAHSGQLLIRDVEWSDKLAVFAQYLPEMQASLPVADEYKQEEAHSNADLNAYDVVYYAGDCNAAGKNIAINLPNDPRVHAQKGSRKLQLKNAMKAKFDAILLPIADILIDEEQRGDINFNAFFENVMFHEVAHGLGVKQTINSDKTVREALADTYSALEEAKADVAGLYFVTKMHEKGVLNDTELKSNYVTFLAGIFRSVRFGATSAHGQANMIEFYYLMENNAFERSEDGKYKINFEKMQQAVLDLAGLIIKTQGDGNYDYAKQWLDKTSKLDENLKADLEKVNEAGIAKDIIFKQGKEVLGL